MITKLVLISLGGVLWAMATFLVPATGQDKADFPSAIESTFDHHTTKLVRTGTAIRKQSGIEVYAVASYIEQGVKPRNAQELAASDHAKELHLVFFRSLAGDEMSRGFLSIFRRNYPEPAFADEVKLLMGFLERAPAKRGHQIWITHVPKVGLRCRRQGQEDLLIRTPAFSRAVWDNYLGENNAGETVKEGLVSEL